MAQNGRRDSIKPKRPASVWPSSAGEVPSIAKHVAVNAGQNLAHQLNRCIGDEVPTVDIGAAHTSRKETRAIDIPYVVRLRRLSYEGRTMRKTGNARPVIYIIKRSVVGYLISESARVRRYASTAAVAIIDHPIFWHFVFSVKLRFKSIVIWLFRDSRLILATTFPKTSLISSK